MILFLNIVDILYINWTFIVVLSGMPKIENTCQGF